MSLTNLVLSEEMQERLAAQKEFVEKVYIEGDYSVFDVEKHLEFKRKISEEFFIYTGEQKEDYTFSLMGKGVFKCISIDNKI